MTRFEKFTAGLFLAATIAQLLLGLWRAYLLKSSVAPAIVLAAIIGSVGVLWLARRRDTRLAFLAKPAALLFATVAVLSAMSAANAPFLGLAARVSTPLFALSAAALLMLAEQSPRVHIVPLLAFLVAVIGLQIALTSDARWESRRSQELYTLVMTLDAVQISRASWCSFSARLRTPSKRWVPRSDSSHGSVRKRSTMK